MSTRSWRPTSRRASLSTPAKRVVITPMAPLALRDRQAGTVTLTTSQAMWKKLDRIRRNPGVAVAYHVREHGLTDRSDFSRPGPGRAPRLPPTATGFSRSRRSGSASLGRAPPA